MEAKPVRGKERKIPSYLAQRGWWDAEVQRVVREWEPVLGQEAVEDAFLVLRRWYEDGTGTALAVHGPRHLNFVRGMASALERLHDPGNCAGWVIKMCGRLKPGIHKGRLPLLSFEQMAREIKAHGGPKFTVDALKKAAQRLKVSGV
jgi:hypothetical protein